ncbi:hypothetical protein A2276_05605 [candidate division WOR-1 bacterium RIFOXYA12_FULL_43_27]|uniref:Uncharacterized protein n=1 Tax=candidate division WOR-1 bacterium RIFOXYC2_FULL_46_14 TaxID=1802587 RepID=A0A1F4U5G8_UNCSA|nr:MAG: hypothetical protein A2276_05605 [candidate division WOR-1 bacterium RIFOXYA12_FULL_43_27]OGC20141.1 MAG: hypothetical protein A2292_03610 [candidate division WOR-1 bacterium RIFOXYB2_FULL_46_45]OGC32122.1 MAG: hypothetical protein A2232_07840 [candidate division WOR-1 bacterium RIFOXYA2_FULL_46_56]OGC39523.1 MAG: hypothetical protein A2438_08205 [candidate division WOR-1 bacterium RIFOXYC2_FULL_46_14]
MSINVIDSNVMAQQAAQAMSTSLNTAVRDIDKQSEDNRVEEQSLTKRLLDNKKPNKKGASILADLISKLGGELKLNQRNEQQRGAKDEYDLMFGENRENYGDNVSVNSDAIKKLQKFKKETGERHQKEQEGIAGEKREIKGNVKDYASAYSQMVVSGGSEAKKKIDKMEQQLKENGVTEGQLLGLRQDVKTAIRSQVAAQIKEGLLKRMFGSDKPLDKALNSATLNKVINHAFNSKELGGWDFGGYNDSLQGTVDEKMAEVTGEIKDFSKEEIERLLVANNLEQKGADKELRQMLELAGKFGFNAKEFLENWQVTSFDLGLNNAPDQDNARDDRKHSQFFCTGDEDKDLLINQLRACYMRRALDPGLRTLFETSFKIRNIKNSLKLEIKFGDFEMIQNEGKKVARQKLHEMLEEALCEQATLYDLAGPAYKMISQRIKSITRNLERLGVDLSSAEFKEMVDSANRKMFEIARQEFEETKILFAGNPRTSLEKKLKMLAKLLKRLIDETGIEAKVDLNITRGGKA